MKFTFSKISFIFLFYLLSASLSPLFSQDAWKEYVTIYDDFDEELYGRSINRDILRSISINNFFDTDTYPVSLPEGYLTSVVLSTRIAERILAGRFDLQEEKRTIDGKEVTVYTFNRQGIRFSFSLEKPHPEILKMIAAHYRDSKWKDPVLEHYKDNYIIRIFSSENIFDPWNEEVTYNEALMMATMIGDYSQWLWGIHDGNNLMGRLFLNDPEIKPDVFE